MSFLKFSLHPVAWGCLSCLFAASVWAQSNTLEAVSVTAKPIVENVAVDAASAISAVVTQEQLRDQNAIDLGAALRRTPGVQISRYNPVGAFGGDQGGAVYIRGMGVTRPGSEIKTYVDGIPFYMGLWSHPLLDLLPINGMESITVYKSPQIHVNGNNFASINLTTRRPTEEGVHGDVRLSAGTHQTWTEQLNLQGRQGSWDWSLAQGHAQSEGHRSNAQGKLNNLMGSATYHLNPQWRVGASVLAVDNKAKDPGDARVAVPEFAPQYNTKASMVTAYVAHEHGSASGELRLYSNKGRGDWLDQPAPDGDTINRFRMSGVRWKESWSPWQDGKLTVGVDYDRITGDATFNRIAPAQAGYFDAPSFKIFSPYVLLSQSFALSEQWSLMPSAGLRNYQHSEFASKLSPQVGLSLISDHLTVFANLSSGTNYPGLETPLLSSLMPVLGDSWQQLGAERLQHAEVGIQWAITDSTQLDISVFQDRVKNRYVFGFPPDVPPPPQFINLGKYTVRGAELSVSQQLARDWTLFTGVTLLDPSLENLPYSPRRAVTIGLNGQVGPLRIAVDAQYQSAVWALSRSRTAGALNTERVGSFAVANARVAYPVPALGKQGEVFLSVDNLLNRQYSYRPGYPMPGRTAQLGFSASF